MRRKSSLPKNYSGPEPPKKPVVFFVHDCMKILHSLLREENITPKETIYILNSMHLPKADGYYDKDGNKLTVYIADNVRKTLTDQRNINNCKFLLQKYRETYRPSDSEIHYAISHTHIPTYGDDINMGSKRFSYDSRKESEECLKNDDTYYGSYK